MNLFVSSRLRRGGRRGARLLAAALLAAGWAPQPGRAEDARTEAGQAEAIPAAGMPGGEGGEAVPDVVSEALAAVWLPDTGLPSDAGGAAGGLEAPGITDSGPPALPPQEGETESAEVPSSSQAGSPFELATKDFSWLDAPAGAPRTEAVEGADVAVGQFEHILPSAPDYQGGLLPPPQGAAQGIPQQFPVRAIDNEALGNLLLPDIPPPRLSIRVGGARIRYGAQVTAGAAYNNNVFGSSSNPQGDLIFSLQPSLAVETGNKHLVRFVYAPSILKYARYKQFDSLNQNFLFSTRYRGRKVQVGLDAGFLTQSGLFLSSQGQARQQSLFARLFATYPLTAKTSLLFALEGNTIQSDPGQNQSRVSVAFAADYRYSSKTTVGAGITLGYYSLPGGTIRYEEFLLRLRYAPTAKLALTAEGGIQFRQALDNTGVSYSTSTTILNASLAYQITSKTLLTLRFFRNVSVDAFVPDSMLVLTGIQGSLSCWVFERGQVEAIITSGYAENSSLAGTDTSSYFFNQGTLSLNYFPRPTVNIRLFTSFQQRLRDTMASNYLSNTTGMSVGVGF